jgi:hypothetical protein
VLDNTRSLTSNIFRNTSRVVSAGSRCSDQVQILFPRGYDYYRYDCEYSFPYHYIIKPGERWQTGAPMMSMGGEGKPMIQWRAGREGREGSEGSEGTDKSNSGEQTRQ